MRFIYYPRCSTCQKAKKWLETNGFSFDEQDIKSQPPSADEMILWAKNNQIDSKKFFNTSGLVYRSLGLKDKLPQMNDEERFALLETDGMLIKRPLLIMDDGKLLIGFKEALYEENLLK